MKYSLKNKMGLVLSFLAIMALSSCDNILPVPSIGPDSSSSGTSGKIIATPENVRATHGRKGVITISWTPIVNAQYYFIYKANSPHDKYIQIDEASAGSSFIDIKVPSGTSGYFKVAAVDAYEHVSDLSLAVYGTSLATPVITAIEEKEDTATVYWYMDNASEDSYLDKVIYYVHCYKTDGTEQETKRISATTETVCTFENLSSATRYLYEVETFIVSEQENIEKSLKIDSETAVNLSPKAAKFTVSDGTFTDKIQIKITLPQIGQIISETGHGGASVSSYEKRPLYFKILRREKIDGENNAPFTERVSYLNFRGETRQLVDSNTTAQDFYDGTPWNDYSEGNEIIYEDVIEANTRGVKYEYQVVSYVDCYYSDSARTKKIEVHNDPRNTKSITGWAAAKPKFVISKGEPAYADNPTEEDPFNKSKISEYITFNSTWNSLGKESDYAFLIRENYKKLDNEKTGIPEIDERNSYILNGSTYYFNSLSEINEFIREYNFSIPVDEEDEANAPVRGCYNYSLCIVLASAKQTNPNPNASAPSLFIEEPDASNIIISNKGDMPESIITDAKSGYSNKTVIKFKYSNRTDYKIKRRLLTSEEQVDTTVDDVIYVLYNSASAPLSGAKPFTVSDGIATYEDTTLESGKKYSFSLLASNEVYSEVESTSVKVETLGKPEIIFDRLKTDYNSITVEWEKVLQASEYVISHNGSSWTLSAEELETETGKEVIDTDDYTVECLNGRSYTFKLKAKAISDFVNNGKSIESVKAGNSLSLTVEAKSDVASVSSVIDNARILGPAKINLHANQAEDDNLIKLGWDLIDGVSLYCLRRESPNFNDSENPHIDYFYISDSCEVFNNNEKVSSDRIDVQILNGSVQMQDKQKAADEATIAYQTSQEYISWGVDFIYSVTPVKSQDDNPFEDGFCVTYSNINNSTSGTAKKGFTKGYGMNIKASKGESPDTIHVTWDAPNEISKRTLNAHLWARKAGSTKWISIELFNPNGDNEYDVHLGVGNLNEKDIRSAKVEFAVNYTTDSETVFEKSYISYLASKGTPDSKGNVVEPDNVGYEFTLPAMNIDIPKGSSETFAERISWPMWDKINDSDGSYDPNVYRLNKPGDGMSASDDCYEIYVKNYNCSSKWYLVATISNDGTFNSKADDISYVDGSTTVRWAHVTVNGKVNGREAWMTLQPNDNLTDSSGYHDGLLKVMRDYKHYYKIVAKRKNSEGTIISTVLGEFDVIHQNDPDAMNPYFTYRKITTEEFAKCVALNLADAMVKVGGQDGSSISGALMIDAEDVKGTFKIHSTYSKGSVPVNYNLTYEANNYINIFKKSPGSEVMDSETLKKLPNVQTSIVSDFILNCSTGDNGYAYNNTAYMWGKNTVTVTHKNNLPSYQGTLTCNIGRCKNAISPLYTQVWDGSLECKNNSSSVIYKVSASDNKTVLQSFFPYPLGTKIKEQNDGTNSSYPAMNGIWWEVRP